MFAVVCLMTGGAKSLGKSKEDIVKVSCAKFGKWLSDQIVFKEEIK